MDCSIASAYSKLMSTRTFHVSVLCFAVFVFGLALAASRAADVTVLDLKDRSLWREPLGEWTAASSVKLNSTNAKIFQLEAGTGILANGPKGRTSNLLTRDEFGDCEAHIEFCVPKDSNSGIYFLGRYEVQVFDSFAVKKPKYSDCGGLYMSCSEPKPDSTGTPPRVNASKAPGEWQTFDVVFRAPRFDASGKKSENARFIKVTHNGVVIHENVESPRPTCAAWKLDEKARGPIMLQGDHGPVAYRNIQIKSVELK
jgi:hypothetical protein